MADTDVNVLINGGRDSLPVFVRGLSCPDETTMLDGTVVVGRVAFETAKEAMPTADMDELEEGAVLGCNANRMPGSADPSTRAMASAIASAETFSKAIDVLAVEPDMVTPVDHNRVDETASAAKLLLVERRFTIVQQDTTHKDACNKNNKSNQINGSNTTT